MQLTRSQKHHIIDCIHRDFLNYVLDRNYARNLLSELGFLPTQVFGSLELLGLELEKAEDKNGKRGYI
jgi:hypothetical protein